MFCLIKIENSDKKVNMNLVPLLGLFWANFAHWGELGAHLDVRRGALLTALGLVVVCCSCVCGCLCVSAASQRRS